MTRREKLITKLRSHPKDFTFDEAEALLLLLLGFERSNKGRTSGSKVGFFRGNDAKLYLHRPHPENALKPYQVRQLIGVLEEKGLI